MFSLVSMFAILPVAMAGICPTPSVSCNAKHKGGKKAFCGQEGTLMNPSYLVPTCTQGTLKDCENNCLGLESCFSFSYGTNGCALYTESLKPMGYTRMKGTSTRYYNKNCLSYTCTHTCPPPAATVTSVPGSSQQWNLHTYNCGTDTILVDGAYTSGSSFLGNCPNTSADPECAINTCLKYLYGQSNTTDFREFAVYRENPGFEGQNDWACAFSQSPMEHYNDFGYNKYDEGATYFYLLEL